MSCAAVSEITGRLWEEYEAFTRRDLSEFDIVYLFVDGIAERLRAGCAREPVIAAWGIGRNGQKVCPTRERACPERTRGPSRYPPSSHS